MDQDDRNNIRTPTIHGWIPEKSGQADDKGILLRCDSVPVEEEMAYRMGIDFHFEHPLVLGADVDVPEDAQPQVVVRVQRSGSIQDGVTFNWPLFGMKRRRLPFTLVVSRTDRDIVRSSEKTSQVGVGLGHVYVTGLASVTDDLHWKTGLPFRHVATFSLDLDGDLADIKDQFKDESLHRASARFGFDRAPMDRPLQEIFDGLDAWAKDELGAGACEIKFRWQICEEEMGNQNAVVSCPAFSRVPDELISIRVYWIAPERKE